MAYKASLIPVLLAGAVGPGEGEAGDLLDDQFLTAVAAGSVDATPAEPGPGTRSVTDTLDDLVITGGEAVFTPNASADPALWYGATSRVLGRILYFKMQFDAFPAADFGSWGFDDAENGSVRNGFVYATSDDIKVVEAAVTGDKIIVQSDLAVDTDFEFLIVLRATGQFLFYKGNNATQWQLIFQGGTDTTASLIPAFAGHTLEAGLDAIKIPGSLWWPRPMLSDGFADDQLPLIEDHGAGDHHATPINVGLGGSSKRAKFNGVNGRVTGPASLAAALFPDECSIIFRCKVDADAGADGNLGTYLTLWTDSDNYVLLRKNSSDNVIVYAYRSSGTSITDTKTAVPTNTWFTIGMDCSISAGTMVTHFDGAQIDSKEISEVYVGAVASVNIGDLPGSQYFKGVVGDVIFSLSQVVISAADHTTIEGHLDAGTLTDAILDGIMGAGRWVWYKMDEVYTSDGAGHAEGDASPLAYIGSGLYPDSTGVLQNANPLMGPTLLANGGFDDWTADDPDGWTIDAESGSDPEVSEVGTGEAHGGSGTGMANIYSTATNIHLEQAAILTVGEWYRFEFNFDTKTTGDLRITDTLSWLSKSLVTTGVIAGTFKALRSGWAISGLGATDCTVDDLSVKALAKEDLTHLAQFADEDVIIDIDITSADNYQAGIALNVDDPDDFQNGVLIYVDTGATDKVWVVKYVSGSVVAVQNAAITYSAGATLQVRKIGDQYRTYYNGTLVGTASTINNALIVSNKYHGAFISGVGASVDNLVVWAVTGYDTALADIL